MDSFSLNSSYFFLCDKVNSFKYKKYFYLLLITLKTRKYNLVLNARIRARRVIFRAMIAENKLYYVKELDENLLII
jgi:hypothetical protein